MLGDEAYAKVDQLIEERIAEAESATELELTLVTPEQEVQP